MKVGMIGLGNMGIALAARLIKASVEVIGYDVDTARYTHAHAVHIKTTATLEELAACAVIWIMIPAAHVDVLLNQLLPHLNEQTIIVDGGNSYFEDSMRRERTCAARNIFFLDCGVSGGIHGGTNGFALMVGGHKQAYEKIHALLTILGAPQGVGYMGPSGAGHYVKMVHNGIEYALLQAYGEGFHLLKEGNFKEVPLDLEEIARVWNHGSVIRSWILTLCQELFEHDQELNKVIGSVEETGMGKWTVENSKKNNVSLPVIETALRVRAWSRETGGDYGTKVVALLRNLFGGHPIKKVTK